MIHRVRERQAFVRLKRHGTRFRRSVLWCTWYPDPGQRATSVAYAIGRACGPAVIRNQTRRRLKSLITDLDRERPFPPGTLLIGARPTVSELTFEQLRGELTSLVDEVRAMPTPNSAASKA